MTDKSCCTLPTNRPPKVTCPECGHPAIPVSSDPVRYLVSDTGLITSNAYYLCESPDCETVYFDDDGARIRRSDLRVRVGAKETQSPHLVCYCFSHTAEAIEAELRFHGKTTIPDRIRAEIAAGNCECKIKNPRGKCCLGEVMNAVKRIQIALNTGTKEEKRL